MLSNKKISLFLLFGLMILLVLLLGGCAGEEALNAQNNRILKSQENMDGNACFTAKGIDSWRVLNERFLIVYSPSINRPWLIALAQRCGNLREGSNVGFSGRLYERQVCPNETQVLLGNVGCDISAIYPMTKQQSIELIKKNNRAREERDARLKRL